MLTPTHSWLVKIRLLQSTRESKGSLRKASANEHAPGEHYLWRLPRKAGSLRARLWPSGSTWDGLWQVKGCLNQGQVQLKPSSPTHPSGEAAFCSGCGVLRGDFFFPPFLLCLAGQGVPALETEGLRQKALLMGSRGQFPMAPAMLQTNFSKICPFSSLQTGIDRATH